MAATKVVNPVTGREGRCYERHTTYLKSEGGFQSLTFDDVPLWITAYYDGRLWMVCEKSDSLLDKDGQALLLGALDNRQPATAIIHETWVDFFLRNRKELHFNWWDTNDASK